MFRKPKERNANDDIYDIVSENTVSSPFRVKKWVRSVEVEKNAFEKHGIPQTTTKYILREMVKKHQLQTATYGGGAFYADITLSFIYIIAIAWSILLFVVYILLIDALDWRSVPFIISPLLLAVIWRRIVKGMNNGICLGCGKVIKAGEIYCSTECKASSKRNFSKVKSKDTSAEKEKVLSTEEIWKMYNDDGIALEDIAGESNPLDKIKWIVKTEEIKRRQEE